MRFLVATLVGLVALSGCGGSATAPVNGKVKLKNGSDPGVLAGYSVSFELEGAKSSGTGEIQPDGSFKISTFGADDGALPGKHRVAISPPLSPDPDKPMPKPKVAAKYSGFETSGIVVEIKPGKNDVVLEVEGP